MKKKVLIITMVLSSLIILFGIVTYIRLLIKMSQPKVEIAMESSMVSECLTLVSVAITVWIGFAIYNQVEKKEVVICQTYSLLYFSISPFNGIN